jgi:tRNA A37 threonylcarbamoyladenosine modification protein TsaB
MILALRTDKPLAELSLLDDEKEIARHEWEAHRQLAATVVGKIQTFLYDNNTSTDKLKGIIVFTGSGSFTGLRIGATVANAIAYSHNIAVVAGEGESWIESGLEKLKTTKSGKYVIPTYDREPNIAKPKGA